MKLPSSINIRIYSHLHSAHILVIILKIISQSTKLYTTKYTKSSGEKYLTFNVSYF